MWESGNAALPLAPLPRGVVRSILRRLRPAVLVDSDGTVTTRRGSVPVEPDTALAILTSGSKGAPKAVELTHSALSAAAESLNRELKLGEGDGWLCVLPVHHIAGLMTLVRSRAAGAKPVFAAPNDAAAISQGAASAVSVVPTVLARLVDAGADLAHFRVVLVGGGPVPSALVERARAAGAPVSTSYGMTETCGGFVVDGRPVDAVEVKLAPDGEVMVRGPVVTRGYRLDPAATRQALHDGWLHTGDLGVATAAGTLHIRGRKDDVIITGGAKVAPVEVERALLDHPDVAEAVVVGRPDEEWGEAVVAIIVAPVRRPSLTELRDHVRARAPRHAAPRRVEFVDALPRVASGKPDRARVRATSQDVRDT